MRWLLFLLGFSMYAPGQASQGAAQCAAASPDRTVALVELYTSEGCDSCPPADRWLSSLGPRGYAPDRVVPIALHVDYWDYIGWKDPYARAAHSARQRKMARLARAAMVYTPQVLLQGQDFRAWGSPQFDLEVTRINARKPKARIALTLYRDFTVQAEAALESGVPPGEAALFLAAYENKLVSEVKAGKTLPHDYVVLQWVGPLDFRGPRLVEKRALPLLPKAIPAHSGVVAFVQNRSTAEVLQALMLPACPG